MTKRTSVTYLMYEPPRFSPLDGLDPMAKVTFLEGCGTGPGEVASVEPDESSHAQHPAHDAAPSVWHELFTQIGLRQVPEWTPPPEDLSIEKLLNKIAALAHNVEVMKRRVLALEDNPSCEP